MLEPLGLGDGVLLPGDEPDLEPEGHGVGVALLQALVGRVLHLQPDAVAAVVAERDVDLPDRGAIGADLLLGQLDVGRQQGVAAGAAGAGVLHALQPAALALPVPDRVADEIELGRFLEVGDREDVLEGGLQAGVLALLGQELHLQELGVRLPLDGQKIGHRKDRLDLGEIETLAVRC